MFYVWFRQATVWFRVSFDTQYVLWLSLILMMFYVWFRQATVWFRVSFYTQYVLWLSLILMMFYVWFRVSLHTLYVLFIVLRYRLIFDMFYVTFQDYRLRVFMVMVYKALVSLTSVFKDLLFSKLRESRLWQTEFSIYLVEQLLLWFASRIQQDPNLLSY